MNELPVSFGKQNSSQNVSIFNQYVRPEYKEKILNLKKKEVNYNSDSDSGSESESDETVELPVSHMFQYTKSAKAVSSISTDPKGQRFTTTSSSNINLYSYSGMTPTTTNPFSTSSPYESNHIREAKFSLSGRYVVAVPNLLTSFKILDREGTDVCQFSGAHIQMADVRKTNGHLAPIVACSWNPNNLAQLLTGSKDSTVRIWDIENEKQKEVIPIKSSTKVKASVVNSAVFGNRNDIIVASADCHLNVYENNNYKRPAKSLESDGIVSKVDISMDPNLILAKTSTGLKIYDLRNFEKPVLQNSSFAHDSNKDETSDKLKLREAQEKVVGFSPCGKYITIAVSDSLRILDKSDLEEMTILRFDSNVTSINWNGSTNEILVGQENGELCALFSPVLSSNGTQSVLSKQGKKRHVDELEGYTVDIHSIHKAILSNVPEHNHKKRNIEEND